MRKTELFRSNSLDIRPFKRSGYLIKSDALKLMQALRPKVADLIFLDPPFNLGKDYGIRSTLEKCSAESYSKYLEKLLSECSRVLKDGGSLFVYHLPKWAITIGPFIDKELQFRHWIAISMKNGFARGKRLYPAHYALLYYTKGDPVAFSRPKINALTCRHCGEYVRDYGGYRHIIEKSGVNLSDIWDDLSPVRHDTHKNRIANELPQKLTDRVLDISGSPGGLMVDPFVGSGTSLLSASAHDMRFIGNDVSARSLNIARRRLEGRLQK